MALGLTAGIFQIPPHFLSHRFSPFGGEFREPMDPQGTPVPSQASILWGGGALSLLWRVLWLEAQAPPSAGTNRRERRGRLLSSHRRAPRRARQGPGLGSDLPSLGMEQTRGAARAEHRTSLQSVPRSLGWRAVKRQQ